MPATPSNKRGTQPRLCLKNVSSANRQRRAGCMQPGGGYIPSYKITLYSTPNSIGSSRGLLALRPEFWHSSYASERLDCAMDVWMGTPSLPIRAPTTLLKGGELMKDQRARCLRGRLVRQAGKVKKRGEDTRERGKERERAGTVLSSAPFVRFDFLSSRSNQPARLVRAPQHPPT